MKSFSEPAGSADQPEQSMNPEEMESKIDSIKKELADFAQANNIPNLEGRARRGLDPIGIIAVKETDEKVRALCLETGADYDELKKMVLDIQLAGPWEYAKRLKEAEDPAARMWIMLNAANNMGKEREMDLTPGEFIKDFQRVNDSLAEANSDPESFFQKAKDYVLEESKKRFRIDDGVPISELDNGFIAMATNGYEAGIIQDADGLLFVGATEINDDIFNEWGLKSEERDDGRGHKATFFINKKREAIIKKLYPGLVIVMSRNFRLAKAIVKESREVSDETLGHKVYRPTSMKKPSGKMPERIKRNTRIKEKPVPEELSEEEKKRTAFYNRLAFLKKQQTFRDAANKIIEKNREKGRGRVTNDTLEAQVGKTEGKLDQKMEEVKYIIALIESEMGELPSNIDTIVDMAGGAGDLGLAVANEIFLSGKNLEHAIIIDPEEELAGYNKLLFQELPDAHKFERVVSYQSIALQEAEIPDNAVVVAKHACGDLTDTIIEKWAESNSPLLVIMTCCQDKAAERPARYKISQADWENWCHESAKTNSPQNPRLVAEGMAAMTKLDDARIEYLRRHGFEAQLVQTDRFPKGDVIIAKRVMPKK